MEIIGEEGIVERAYVPGFWTSPEPISERLPNFVRSPYGTSQRPSKSSTTIYTSPNVVYICSAWHTLLLVWCLTYLSSARIRDSSNTWQMWSVFRIFRGLLKQDLVYQDSLGRLWTNIELHLNKAISLQNLYCFWHPKIPLRGRPCVSGKKSSWSSWPLNMLVDTSSCLKQVVLAHCICFLHFQNSERLASLGPKWNAM